MSAVLTPPRWQRRAEARPQELLEAALAVFVERGYAAARLDEVARRAGVAKGTLYLYYANKLELFKAVVRHALVESFEQAARDPAGQAGNCRNQLTRLLRAFGQRVACSPLSGIPKLVMAEAGNFPEVARFYHDEVIRRGRELLTGVLARGVERGEFRAVDVDYAWRVVMGPLMLAIIWKHSFQAFDPEPWDFERHLEAHLDLLFNGLAVAGREERDRP